MIPKEATKPAIVLSSLVATNRGYGGAVLNPEMPAADCHRRLGGIWLNSNMPDFRYGVRQLQCQNEAS